MPRTRATRLIARGVERIRAFTRPIMVEAPVGMQEPNHTNVAIPVKWLTEQGLLSLLEEHRRLSSLT